MKKSNPNSPDASHIRVSRLALGLTQKEAADLVGVTEVAWRAWERRKNRMPPGLWKLFRILTDPESKRCLEEAGLR